MKKGKGSGSDCVGAITELANAINLLATALLGGAQGKPIRDEVTKCAARAVKLANGEGAATEVPRRRSATG
jgi:hypothetical protein